MPLYNVHLYREMRVKYLHVEASTPEQAAMRCYHIDPEMCDYENEIHECEGQSFGCVVDEIDPADDQIIWKETPINFEEGRLRDNAHLMLEALKLCRQALEKTGMHENGIISSAYKQAGVLISTVEENP